MRSDVLTNVDRFTPELAKNSCINLSLRKDLYKNVAYCIDSHRVHNPLWEIVGDNSLSAIQVAQIICSVINFKMNRYCVAAAPSADIVNQPDGTKVLRGNETLYVAFTVRCMGADEHAKTKNATNLVWLLGQLGMHTSLKSATDYSNEGDIVYIYAKHIKEIEFIDSILGSSQDMGCKYLLSDVTQYLNVIGPLDNDDKQALHRILDDSPIANKDIFKKYNAKEGGKTILVKNSERVGLQIDPVHYNEICEEIKRRCPLEVGEE